ncbi:urea transporter 2-like isoform 2-T4 [Synchiropus picturatus]
MENERPSKEKAGFFRAVAFFTGDMQACGAWVNRQSLVIQLLDWILRGVAQVMFVNNPFSGLLIAVGLFLQNPWWALNGLVGTLVATVSALLFGYKRDVMSAGLQGYNGTLVGMLMAVFSAKEAWYWWLLLPNAFMSMLCPLVSGAFSSVTSKLDLPVFTLPFNVLLCLHMAATGASHPFFPEVAIQPELPLQPSNVSIMSLDFHKLAIAVPVGVGQVYGCGSPWTGGLILLALLVCSPIICLHAVIGSAAGILSGLALAAPHGDIYSGLWGYNSVLSCIAIGGVFYVLTWQTHLLALICAFFCAYMASAISNMMSVFGLPACTWPFCLSTLIFLLISSETAAVCRLPLSVVSFPEKNQRYRRQQLQASEEEKQQSSHVPDDEQCPVRSCWD